MITKRLLCFFLGSSNLWRSQLRFSVDLSVLSWYNTSVRTTSLYLPCSHTIDSLHAWLKPELRYTSNNTNLDNSEFNISAVQTEEKRKFIYFHANSTHWIVRDCRYLCLLDRFLHKIYCYKTCVILLSEQYFFMRTFVFIYGYDCDIFIRNN